LDIYRDPTVIHDYQTTKQKALVSIPAHTLRCHFGIKINHQMRNPSGSEG